MGGFRARKLTATKHEKEREKKVKKLDAIRCWERKKREEKGRLNSAFEYLHKAT